jgi:hypothetical protein
MTQRRKTTGGGVRQTKCRCLAVNLLLNQAQIVRLVFVLCVAPILGEVREEVPNRMHTVLHLPRRSKMSCDLRGQITTYCLRGQVKALQPE